MPGCGWTAWTTARSLRSGSASATSPCCGSGSPLGPGTPGPPTRNASPATRPCASLNQARAIHTRAADYSTSPETNPPPKPDGTTRRPSHDRPAPPTMRGLLSILLSGAAALTVAMRARPEDVHHSGHFRQHHRDPEGKSSPRARPAALTRPSTRPVLRTRRPGADRDPRSLADRLLALPLYLLRPEGSDGPLPRVVMMVPKGPVAARARLHHHVL